MSSTHLAEQHGNKLIPTTKAFGSPLGLMLPDGSPKCGPIH
jgi:hypothetical protein